MTDYIIVGCGLAGIAFAETALENGKSIVVFDDASQTSSRVAAGIYNPVILKRFSGLSLAQEQLDALKAFYIRLEAKLNIKVDFPMPVLRKFFSIEEQNNWFIASDKEATKQFLSTTLINKTFDGISSPFGFGEVLQTGYVDTQLLLKAYQNYLIKLSILYREQFHYDDLVISEGHLSYRNVQARNIIFAEGFGLHYNPYFNHLPLDGTKGELLIIRAEELDLNCIINTNLFILPLGYGLFKVGATYHWTDKTETPTAEGREELITRLTEIINCEFEVVEHLAGVRPTVKDRKPLVGTHPGHKNVHILNGLGTRGVMLGPATAQQLFNHIEKGETLPKEIDIKRFRN